MFESWSGRQFILTSAGVTCMLSRPFDDRTLSPVARKGTAKLVAGRLPQQLGWHL